MSGGLIGGIGTGMTSGTRVGGLVVRKRRNQRNPHIGGMASLAQFRGLRMSGGFKCSWAGTVMTAGAVAGHARDRDVVEQHLQPVRGVMTQVTRLVGWNVAGAFSAGDDAVMTIGA